MPPESVEAYGRGVTGNTFLSRQLLGNVPMVKKISGCNLVAMWDFGRLGKE